MFPVLTNVLVYASIPVSPFLNVLTVRDFRGRQQTLLPVQELTFYFLVVDDINDVDVLWLGGSVVNALDS